MSRPRTTPLLSARPVYKICLYCYCHNISDSLIVLSVIQFFLDILDTHSFLFYVPNYCNRSSFSYLPFKLITIARLHPPQPTFSVMNRPQTLLVTTLIASMTVMLLVHDRVLKWARCVPQIWGPTQASVKCRNTVAKRMERTTLTH